MEAIQAATIVPKPANKPRQEGPIEVGKRADLKKWIDSLPANKRLELRTASENFANALTQFFRNVMTDLVEGNQIRSTSDASVAIFVTRFQNVPGLVSAWKQIQADEGTIRVQFEAATRESSNLERVDMFQRRSVVRAAVEAQGARMQNVIGDLFGK